MPRRRRRPTDGGGRSVALLPLLVAILGIPHECLVSGDVFANSCFSPCPVGEFVTKPDAFIDLAGVRGFCGELEGNPHLIPPTSCVALQSSPAVRNACGCFDPIDPFECPVCGPDEVITKPDGLLQSFQVTGTCEFVNENQLLIPEDFCETIQNSLLVKNICGCVNPDNPFECPVCGPDQVITKPLGVLQSFEVTGTCIDINNNQRLIPDDFCPLLQSSTIVKDICGCQSPTQSPTPAPTPMPTRRVGGSGNGSPGLLAALLDFLAGLFGAA